MSAGNLDVKSVMTANPAYCAPQTPLREVAQMMIDNDCGQIPVVDANQAPIGVVTDRDIAVRVVAQGRDPSTVTAQDCMSSPVTTVNADSSLADCCNTMENKQVRRVPVVAADGSLCGIVSLADVALSGRDQKTADVVKEVSEPTRG
ncbi:CBS domain-containing protein [Lysobacter koreensis]|uniref:CBS domain-containing protein n=1 Tax=Lysobacter koreensis TaxID=266122 RepID=A0ABW2YJV3_9GAMM